jgi:hypothetical protein
MKLLGESEEDAYLDEGMQAEEQGFLYRLRRMER